MNSSIPRRQGAVAARPLLCVAAAPRVPPGEGEEEEKERRGWLVAARSCGDSPAGGRAPVPLLGLWQLLLVALPLVSPPLRVFGRTAGGPSEESKCGRALGMQNQALGGRVCVFCAGVNCCCCFFLLFFSLMLLSSSFSSSSAGVWV